MSRRTSLIGWVVILCGGLAAGGCRPDLLSHGLTDRTNGPVAPPVVDASPPPPRTDAGTCDADAACDYARMCRNYCQALQETDTYNCLQRPGADSQACQSQWSDTAQNCYALRCVSMRVQPSLCVTQCDTAYRLYSATCARDGADASDLCPWDVAQHHQACLDACVLP